MSYEIERKTRGNLGEIVEISDSLTFYSQAQPGEFLFRVHSNPLDGTGCRYNGVLLKSEIKPSNEDYRIFKALVERYEDRIGCSIDPNEDYFLALFQGAGKHEYIQSRVKASICLRKEGKDYSEYPRLLSHVPGFAVDVLALAGGALASIYTGSIELGLYTFSGAVVESMLGWVPTKIGPKTWCGPVHALGFIPAYHYYKSKWDNPNYAINNVERRCDELDKLMKNEPAKSSNLQRRFKQETKWKKRVEAAKENLNEATLRLKYEFHETNLRKGLVITFWDENLDEVYDFFENLIGEDLAAMPEEEPKPAKVKLTDPWEVDIPTIGEGLR